MSTVLFGNRLHLILAVVGFQQGMISMCFLYRPFETFDFKLGRKAIQLLIQDTPVLSLYGSFGDAVSAGKFMQASPVDLVFLDIKMFILISF